MPRDAELLIALDRAAAESLQAQLQRRLREAILGGRLQPGARLPPTRRLAESLGISRNTVLQAYERLSSEGYLQANAGAGTIVSPDLPEASVLVAASHRPAGRASDTGHPIPLRPPILFRGQAPMMQHRQLARPSIDFWPGRVNWREFPVRIWRQLLVDNLGRAGRNLAEYGDPAGYPDLRAAVAEHLAETRGLSASPDQILVTSGCQEALNLIARIFLEPGVPVAVEDPCYQGMAFAFQSYGAELLPVPVDAEGLVPDNLGSLEARLLYITPSHQYPTGATLSLQRRLAVLDWARQTGALVVEDDYASDFRYDGPPLPSLAGLGRNQSVLYVATLSKSVGAGLRTGFLVVPPDLVEPFVTAKALLSSGHPWLEQAVIADFMRSGDYHRHLRRIRKAYRASRDALKDSLARHFGAPALTGEESGMHLIWRLPDGLPGADQVARAGRAADVGVYPFAEGVAQTLTPHADADADRQLMLGYSSLTPEEVATGIGRLASALDC